MGRSLSNTIYVGNLPGDIRESEVEDLFYKYGRIVEIDLKVPPRPLGYVFVEFEDPRDADDAIRGRDGCDFDGYRLRVELAHGGRRSSSSYDRYSSGSSRGAPRRSGYTVLVTGLPSSASWQDLKGIELQLKHMQGVGLYGWDSIFESILGEWLEDISQNQIHKLLKGLPPIKSLVAVGSGAAKLVSLPLKSYKKDRRLLKGMQRGTIAFLRSISLEAIGLGVHLAAGAHDILLQAEYILTSIPPSVPWPVESSSATNVRSNQPNGAQQGIQQACQSITDGVGKSASALVQSPLKRYRRGASMGSALATAVQGAPAAAMAPAAATARAVDEYARMSFEVKSCDFGDEAKKYEEKEVWSC